MSSSLVGALVLAAALVSAQEPTPEGEGTEGPPVFETGTELVRLDHEVQITGRVQVLLPQTLRELPAARGQS